MKYFTYDLWKLFTDDPDVAVIEYEKRYLEYQKDFNEAKKHLSKKFLNIYNQNDGFHDFEILSFSLSDPCYKKGKTAELIIKNYNSMYKISYKTVSYVHINYDMVLYENNKNRDILGYDEFIILDEEQISHEVLFLSGSTIKIIFYKLSIDRIKTV